MGIDENRISRAGGKFKGLKWGSLGGIQGQGVCPWILICLTGDSLSDVRIEARISQRYLKFWNGNSSFSHWKQDKGDLSKGVFRIIFSGNVFI